MWLSGGSVKDPRALGATDDFGFAAVKKPVHAHDRHATPMTGTPRSCTTSASTTSGWPTVKAGRDFRLTDVRGDVIQGLLA